MNWEDLKIVYEVAKCSSLGIATEKLKLSQSTLIRRINRLEKDLDTTIFIRHQRGYKLTDSGRLLVDQMPCIIESIGSTLNKIQNAEQNTLGTLKITSIPEYTYFLHPVIRQYQNQNPGSQVQLDVSEEIKRLNEGNVHIAIRGGPEPNDTDVIVKKLFDLPFGYFASKSYIEKHGRPQKIEDFDQHFWLLPNGKKSELSFVRKLMPFISTDRITYETNNLIDLESAILSGLGIGPMDFHHASKLPELVHVDCLDIDTSNSLWFVFHKDLKGNAMVRSFYQHFNNYINEEIYNDILC